MKRFFKKNAVKMLALGVTLCAATSLGVLTASAAETEVTPKALSEINYTMMSGASIRTDGTGIRFSATMSEADYAGISAKYSEIEFGAFVMAADYLTLVSKGTFTEAQFFGDEDSDDTTTALYTWDGATVTENRVKILQMESDIYWDEEEKAMRVNGSVTDIYENNLDMDYIGVCYIKADGEYKLATLNDNVRNIVYVSQLAVESNKEVADVNAGNAVLDKYGKLEDAVSNVKYTVNTYVHDNFNGTVLYDTVEKETALNQTVTLSEIAETVARPNGTYNYVASRSTTSGVAYIGDKLTLDLYYHKKADGVLYDFYDYDEATRNIYGSTKKYEQIAGVDAVKYTDNVGGAWTDRYLPSEADEKFDVTKVKNIYFKVYPLEVNASTELRFTTFDTYSTSGTWSGEKHHTLKANTWNYVTVSVDTDTPALSKIPFQIGKNKGGGVWEAIGNTSGEALYIAEIGFFVEAEPTTKEEGVILDFANYRDMEQLSSSYISYNYYAKHLTTNGNGSLKLTCEGQWPEVKFANTLTVDITGASYICMDVYVPTIDEGGYVRIGINNANYQKITTAGEWKTIKISRKTTTLAGQKFNVSRSNGSSWVNVGTIYIGRIYMQ